MNLNILNKVVIFTVGAAIGSAVTWKLVKTKYEQIAQEEIDSVKEVFSRREESKYAEGLKDALQLNKEIDAATKRAIDTEESEKKEMADILDNQRYTNYSNNKPKEETGMEMEFDKPYVIPPDEFGEIDDYNTVSLTYYADGIVTDEMDEPIDDMDDIIGEESLDHFGEYEEDSVFVRNDALRTDYEILKDVRNYSDIED